MRKNQAARKGLRAVSIVLTALAASASYAQSHTASVPTALAQLVQQSAPKAKAATPNPVTPTAKPGPFTYDELGATPSIGARVRTDKAAAEQSKPANGARVEKASQQPATKTPPSPIAR